jgi:multiple sugar transport system permease protein
MKNLWKGIRLGIDNVIKWKFTPYIVLILICLVLLIPFYWSFVTSFKAITEVYKWPPTLIPKDFSLSGYQFSLISTPVLTYLFNSTAISLYVSLIILIITILTIYGLVFYPYRGSNKVFIILFLTRIVPPQVLWLPFIIIFTRFRLLGSWLPVIIYELVLTYPLAVWMFKSIFDAFPREIVEMAGIDGCSRMQALFRVVLPVAAPAVASIGIVSFLWSWNEFMFPFLVLNNKELWPITVGVMGFLGEEGVMWNALSATQVLAITPGLLFFIFAQKYIVKGLTAGSVKG